MTSMYTGGLPSLERPPVSCGCALGNLGTSAGHHRCSNHSGERCLPQLGAGLGNPRLGQRIVNPPFPLPLPFPFLPLPLPSPLLKMLSSTAPPWLGAYLPWCSHSFELWLGFLCTVLPYLHSRFSLGSIRIEFIGAREVAHPPQSLRR